MLKYIDIGPTVKMKQKGIWGLCIVSVCCINRSIQTGLHGKLSISLYIGVKWIYYRKTWIIYSVFCHTWLAPMCSLFHPTWSQISPKHELLHHTHQTHPAVVGILLLGPCSELNIIMLEMNTRYILQALKPNKEHKSVIFWGLINLKCLSRWTF